MTSPHLWLIRPTTDVCAFTNQLNMHTHLINPRSTPTIHHLKVIQLLIIEDAVIINITDLHVFKHNNTRKHMYIYMHTYKSYNSTPIRTLNTLCKAEAQSGFSYRKKVSYNLHVYHVV